MNSLGFLNDAVYVRVLSVEGGSWRVTGVEGMTGVEGDRWAQV